ncbi:AMP-binding protein [Enterocloster clostridioformis]|nr:AMP-binding protein [Enterocloster clostridioformis]
MDNLNKCISCEKIVPTLDQLLEQCATISDVKVKGIHFMQSDGTEVFESYEELYFHAKQILGGLQKRGFQRGSYVVFQIKNNQFFIRLFWACVLGGIIPAPLSVPLTASSDSEAFKKLIKVLDQLSNACIISDEENINIFKETYEENDINYLEYEVLRLSSEEGQCDTLNPYDVAYIQYSSGSTGNPKGVMLTHQNLAYNFSQITERINLQTNDVMGSWLPLTHDMGLVAYHLTPIYAQITQFHLNTNYFIRRPWLYLHKMSQLHVTVAVSPNFGLEWMMDKIKESQIDNVDLSRIRMLICGSEPISMNTIRKFYEKFIRYGLRDNTIHHAYGMAEACVGITISLDGDNNSVLINRHKISTGYKVEYVNANDPNVTELAVVGQPLKGIEVLIVDDENMILQENYVGNIIVKGPNVFSGYLNNDSVILNRNGFFDTGDLGFMCNGRLIIAGRKKDILFINGQNYYASDIENMLKLALPQLPEIVVAAYRSQTSSKDEIAIFVHSRGKDELFSKIAQQIAGAVFERIGVGVDYVLPIKTIPRTTSGKVQRYRLIEQLDNHEFDDVLTIAPHSYFSNMESKRSLEWKKMEINNQILRIAREVFSIPSLEMEDVISQMGISSLTLIRFQDEIEQKFQVEISIASILKASTLEQVSALIRMQINKNKINHSILMGNSNIWYEPFPVTEIQEAYLIGRQNIMEMGNVSAHAYYEFETKLDISRLNDALNCAIKHQFMLRTVFDETGLQKVRRNVPYYKILTEDLQELSPNEQYMRIVERRNSRSHFVFQQDKWPLFEFSAFILSEGRTYLFIDVDLLIADGGSILILINEIMNYYNNPNVEVEPLRFQFSDYVNTLQNFRQSSSYKKAKAYWQAKAENFAQAPKLSLVCEVESIDKPTFKRLEKKLSEDTWSIVKKLSKQHGVTTSVLLATIYTEILCKWSNQCRIALNLTLFNRQPFHPDVMRLIGDFTSILLLDIDMSAHSDFWQKADMIQDILFEALDHRFYSGVEFIRDIARKQELSGKAIMPIVFTSMLFEESEIMDNTNSMGDIKYGISQTPQVFLDFQVMEREGGLLLTWDYVEEIFDKDMITAMFEAYLNRLRQVIQNNLAAIPLPMKEAELLADYNNTTVDYQVELLQRLIDRQCRKTPNAIAVKLGEATLSYGDLARKSNQIARYLREQKYEHGSYIGVWAERQIETIINIVGILKAGYAYVPVNPEHPQDRINHILKHSGCKLLVYPDLYEEENLSAYEDESYEAGENDNQDSIQDIAYAIYTSGSTGYPKGVVITHEAVVNTLLDINEKFKVNEKDKIIGLSSMCFDLSVYDIFGALICGAQLVMIPDLMDMDNIYQVVNREEITIWNSVPAIMDMYIENSAQRAGNEPQTSLRVVMMSGDWIPLGLPEKIKNQMSGAEIISLGGATEGSIWSIYFPIKEILPDWKSIRKR